MHANGYVALLIFFLIIVSFFLMQFLYAGSEDHIYSLTRTLNTLMTVFFPFISVSVVAAYIFITHFNKNKNMVATGALLVFIISSPFLFKTVSNIANDLYHIYSKDYIVTTAKPLIHSISHGFELTMDEYVFEVKLHNPYPAYAAPQLRRIKKADSLEIRHYGNRILEIKAIDSK